MKFICVISMVLLTTVSGFTQKPFSGILKYKATVMAPDSNVIWKSWNVTLYTNDTVVRVETETQQFGVQVYIRNMELNKAYLLLELDGNKYAIQTDLSKKKDSIQKTYTVTRKTGSKKIAGLKAKKYLVQDENTEGFYCYFAKNLSNKYLQVYPEVKGLALDYYIPSQDGLIHYELVEKKDEQVNRDLFGIPSDYKRISFEEFMHVFYSNNEQ
ncbi:hypothetical protein [Fluviicola chungangensis]|uniref:DUF4412 domain-containing protein n=1 Tax=Fluviicola chungangensis TaxID=2597671 RepID=A0A556MYA4_9FLAO|nr:hypothetical protein [Fluviicola chungangensis]TSJ44769.1 hypothetical protein FO442_09210 [Fluviicola chungangensis]